MEMATSRNCKFTITGDFQAKAGPMCVWGNAQVIPEYEKLEHMTFKVFSKLSDEDSID